MDVLGVLMCLFGAALAGAVIIEAAFLVHTLLGWFAVSVAAVMVGCIFMSLDS